VSIYRGWKPEHDYRPAERLDRDGPGNGAQSAPPIHLRKLQPANTLLPKTALWLASLPDAVRPAALAQQFARIANGVALTWHSPGECRQYFGELLIDKRGGRKGFPPDVMGELLRLRNYHATLHPSFDAMWQDVRATRR
jgi:hypothetical protein